MAKKQAPWKIDETLLDRVRETADEYGTDQYRIVESAIERELDRLRREAKPLFSKPTQQQ